MMRITMFSITALTLLTSMNTCAQNPPERFSSSMHADVEAIVLAAGRGTRFKSGKSKMLETICGQEMVLFPLKLLQTFAVDTTIVVGFEKERVMECIEKNNFNNITFLTQPSFVAGTGDAVRCTTEVWHKDHILILNGDMPLVNAQVIHELYEAHITSDAALSFVIAYNTEPGTGYGRIVQNNEHIKIVEAKDFTGDINKDCFINAGIYLVKHTFLAAYINKLDTNNASKEFYITDLVAIADAHHYKVTTSVAPFDTIRGVNDQQERAAAEHIVHQQLLTHWMKEGVHFADPRNVHIDIDVTIGAGSSIGFGAQLLRGTTIGSNCVIKPYVVLENCVISDNAHIDAMSICKNTFIEPYAYVSPFSYRY